MWRNMAPAVDGLAFQRAPAQAAAAIRMARLAAVVGAAGGGVGRVNPLHLELLMMNRDFTSEDYEACAAFTPRFHPHQIHTATSPRNAVRLAPHGHLMNTFDIFFTFAPSSKHLGRCTP